MMDMSLLFLLTTIYWMGRSWWLDSIVKKQLTELNEYDQKLETLKIANQKLGGLQVDDSHGSS